jgi:uncharacterized protein (DUF1501 family)
LLTHDEALSVYGGLIRVVSCMDTRKGDLTRRQFIAGTARAGIAYAGLRGLSKPLASLGAATQDEANEDFKALVCLFLYGGNDSNNAIVPIDESSYREYQKSRKNLALDPTWLLKISNPGGDGRVFGLHPSLGQIQSLYEEGKAAIVANVGTLAAPIVKADYVTGAGEVPQFLFAHAEQQIEWQTSMPDPAIQIGWGGRLADLLRPLNADAHVPMNMSMDSNNIFQSGNETFPTAVDPSGVESGTLVPEEKLIRQALGRSPESNDELLNSASQENVSQLALQMRMVLKIIGARKTLGMKRQIFFVTQTGFDLHDDAPRRHATLVKSIGDALYDFYLGTRSLGLENNVVTFTASDFNRTLVSSGTGSGHGWGSHQFVLGGAVKGGRIFGKMPAIVAGGADDIGNQGIWLPSLAVDQYAATLSRWFGVSESDLPAILPNIRKFDLSNLRFLG